MQSLGIGSQGLGFIRLRIEGSGSRRYTLKGVGLRVQGLGFRLEAL